MNNNFHLVLYRKYRPQSFNEMVGQNHITEPLKRAVSSNRISHSYLFSGPKGTGKTSAARILAKAANCETQGEDGEPCNKCASCKEIAYGNSIDLTEIDAASNRGIDEIRALREAVRLNPLKSKYKVYIIDEVHMMTKDAFNALLKTLEEPPPFAIFILATTESEKIPETISSRCQHFKFKKMTDDLMRQSLSAIAEKEGVKIDEGALNLIAMLSDGSLRDAHAKLEQIIDFETKEVKDEDAREFFGAPPDALVQEFIEAAFSKDGAKLAEIARLVSKQGLDGRLFIKLVLRVLRFIMLCQLSPSIEYELRQTITYNELNLIKQIKTKTSAKETERLIKILLNGYVSPIHSYFPELPLEIAAAEIAEVAGKIN